MVILLRFGLLASLLWLGCAIWAWQDYQPLNGSTKKLVGLARNEAAPERLATASVKKPLTLLLKSDLWGSKQQVSNPGVQATGAPTTGEIETWSRIAVVKDPQGAYVLLRSPTGELKTFKNGDTLPDESKLKKISAESVEVRLNNGKSQTYRFVE